MGARDHWLRRRVPRGTGLEAAWPLRPTQPAGRGAGPPAALCRPLEPEEATQVQTSQGVGHTPPLLLVWGPL